MRYRTQNDKEIVVDADTMQHQEQLACTRRLAVLAAGIRSEHEATAASLKRGLEHAIHAGQLLIEAKALLQHGQWLPWLRDHCALSDRTARLYTRLANHRAQIEGQIGNVADLSVRGAVALIATPKESGLANIAPKVVEAALDHLEFADFEYRMREREKRLAAKKAFDQTIERIKALADQDPAIVAVAESVWDQDLLGERVMSAIATCKSSVLAGDYMTATTAVLEAGAIASEMLRRVEAHA